MIHAAYFVRLQRNETEAEKGEQLGKAIEHFILMEILAHRAYREPDYDVNFWRTKSGLEVDFILGQGEVASEEWTSGK
jgi:predicted AAA+ superfamily ATPase